AIPRDAVRQDAAREDASALARDLPAAIDALRSHLQGPDWKDEGPWGLTFPRTPRGTKPIFGPWNELAKELIGQGAAKSSRSAFGWIPQDAGEILSQYREIGETLQTLLALVRALGEAYEAYKAERGLLDFADLELRARRLLRDAPPELRARFAMVFVDEFQDVNQLQADIVRQLDPPQGRFLVGDVKQCIYQFRLSDPSIFRDLFAGAVIERPGDPVASAKRVRLFLSRNFRSRVPVLAAVNELFATLLRPHMIGGAYEDEALAFGAQGGLPEPEARDWVDRRPALTAGGGEPAAGPDSAAPGWAPVELHLLDRPPSDLPLPENPVHTIEARLVAQRIRALLADRLPVFDEESRTWRPVRCSDIAVILRSPKPTGPTFARVLREEGLPVSFAGSDFFRRQEVRDFRSLIRTLENAHDDIDLAAVLRMPAFGFRDGDLARLRLIWPESLYLLSALRATATGVENAWSGPRAGRDGAAGSAEGDAASSAGDDSPVAADADLVRRCHVFLSALERWRLLVRSGDLASAIATALEESGLLVSTAAAGGSGANLQQLLDLARRYEQEQDHSLSGLIAHLEAVEATGEIESAGEEDAEADAVRLLSLHKAKGLEFPVVILALLGRDRNRSESREQVITGEDWLGVDALDPREYVKTPTLARSILRRVRLDASHEEELRILYVALTRAREKLILCGTLSRAWEKLRPDLAPWSADGPLAEELLYRAQGPLDWILGGLCRAGLLPQADAEPGRISRGFLEIERHDFAALVDAAARDAEPRSSPDAELQAARAALPGLEQRLARPYAYPAAPRWRGKYWVTELKRLIDEAVIEEEAESGSALLIPSASVADGTGARQEARLDGIRLHALLEALPQDAWAAAVAGDAAARLRVIADAAEALRRRGELPEGWATPERVAPIEQFLT
ncbi:MAG: AAA family ATPase, partial [Candidatus Eisenbacteria bacterium]|nr:AAA family ATPase [Candidatus Eisenbacteria bacterium]